MDRKGAGMDEGPKAAVNFHFVRLEIAGSERDSVFLEQWWISPFLNRIGNM